MLNLSALFHLNLMYSSIAETDRLEVIRRCYHPLLDLVEKGVPAAIEATGLTLEIAADLDPGWLERLRGLVHDGRTEFVGSGHAQIIGPLVPAEVTARNLAFGRQDYRRLLDHEPEIWLVNEMAWSGGLVELYAEAGACAVVMEWNNAWKGHPEWDVELRYHRQNALGPDGLSLPVLWIDTLDFQKLQRTVTGELTTDELLDHWRPRVPAAGAGPRYASVYGSDAEVFDFRPGRFAQEDRAAPTGEWERLHGIAQTLAAIPDVVLTPLAAALDEPDSDHCGLAVRLESPDQPVVVKKQQKYNLNRWAVTGRDDLEANTICHDLARRLIDDPSADPTLDYPAWRRLCRLWSSDFRTHITPERWTDFRRELLATAPPRVWRPAAPGPPGEPLPVVVGEDRMIRLATDTVRCALDPGRGLALRSLEFPLWGEGPVLGTLLHGYYQDIAFGADFYSGHAVMQEPGQAKRTDLQKVGNRVEVWRRPNGTVLAAAEIRDGGLVFTKRILLRTDRPEVELQGELCLPQRRAAEIHPLHLTLIPGFFDPQTLFFAVRNGGRQREVFRLGESDVHHGEAYSTLITATGGLGATDGEILLGDDKRCLVIRHNPTVSALMPTLRCSPVHGGSHFLRLRYSAQEVDETFVANDEPWRVAWSVTVAPG